MSTVTERKGRTEADRAVTMTTYKMATATATATDKTQMKSDENVKRIDAGFSIVVVQET